MPPPILPLAGNDIVEMRIVQTQNNCRVLNTLHFLAELSGTSTEDFVAVMDAFDETEKGPNGRLKLLNDIWSNNLIHESTQYQIVKPQRLAHYDKIGTGPGKRTPVSGGTYLPQNSSAAVTFRPTGTAPLEHPGGIRIGGLLAADAVNGTVSQPLVTLLDAFCDRVPEAVEVNGTVRLIPVIYGPGALPRVHIIWDASPRGEIRTMHRRRVGLGQ